MLRVFSSRQEVVIILRPVDIRNACLVQDNSVSCNFFGGFLGLSLGLSFIVGHSCYTGLQAACPLNKQASVDDITFREEFVELSVSKMTLKPAIEQYWAPAVDAMGKAVFFIVLTDFKNRCLPLLFLGTFAYPINVAFRSETPADNL